MLQGGRTIFLLVPPIPESITYKTTFSLSAGNQCHSIDSDNSADMIVFGCGKYILTYDSNLPWMNRFSSSSGTNAQSIGLHRKDNKVYYSDASWSISYVGLDSLEKPIRVPLTARRSFASKEPVKIAVSDDYLALSNTNDHPLQLYRFSDQELHSHLLYGESLQSLKFHPDGDLITLDFKGRVSKFTINDYEEPKLIWKCCNVEGAYALCVDQERGLVYVTGREQSLHFIYGGKKSYGTVIVGFEGHHWSVRYLQPIMIWSIPSTYL